MAQRATVIVTINIQQLFNRRWLIIVRSRQQQVSCITLEKTVTWQYRWKKIIRSEKKQIDKSSVHGGLVISVTLLFNFAKKNKKIKTRRAQVAIITLPRPLSPPTAKRTHYSFLKGKTSCSVNHSVACRLIEIHHRLDPEAHLPAAISTMLLNTINSSATSP